MYTLPNSLRHLKKGHILSLNGKAYTIQCAIGEGGQCIVYEATTPDETAGIDRTVVIRELFPRKSDIERKGNGKLVFPQDMRELWLEQFKSEYIKYATITEKMRSAFSFPLDYAEANNTGYMIIVPEKAVSFDRVFVKYSLRFTIKILSKVASIVADLHKEHMVHADLKPANILLINSDIDKEECEVRLLDCGGMVDLSKPKDSIYISYTQEYASPEIKYGITDRISPAADVYSIAAILAAKLGIPADEFTGKVEYCNIGMPMRYDAFTLLNTILSYNLATATRARDNAARLSEMLEKLYNELYPKETEWLQQKDFFRLLHEACRLKSISTDAAKRYLEPYPLSEHFFEEDLKHLNNVAWECYQQGKTDESIFIFSKAEELSKKLETADKHELWRMHDLYSTVLSNAGEVDDANKQRDLTGKFRLGRSDKINASARSLNYSEERFDFDAAASEAARLLEAYNVTMGDMPLEWLKLRGKQGQNLLYADCIMEARLIFDEIEAFFTVESVEFPDAKANRKQSLSYMLHYYLADFTEVNKKKFIRWQSQYFDCEPISLDNKRDSFIAALDKLRKNEVDSNSAYQIYTLFKAGYLFEVGSSLRTADIKEIILKDETISMTLHPYELISKYKFLLAAQCRRVDLAQGCLHRIESKDFADTDNLLNYGLVALISLAALCECAKAADRDDQFKKYYNLLRSKIEQAQANGTIIQGYFDCLNDSAKTLEKFRYMYS